MTKLKSDHTNREPTENHTHTHTHNRTRRVTK